MTGSSGGRDKTGATPRSLSRLALTTSLPARWGGVGVSVEGGWRPAGWWASPPCCGPGALRRGQGAIFSLCLWVSCLLGGVPMAAASVLDPDAECSTDVILVGSSQLSCPPSPGLRRGEGSLRYWTHHLGCQPQAWQHHSDTWQGQEGPTQSLPHQARMFNMPGKAEGRGWWGSSGSCDFRKSTVTDFSAIKWQIGRSKGPLLNFLFQILLHMKSRLTSET